MALAARQRSPSSNLTPLTDVAIIVPVVGRPQNAARFMVSLEASGTYANVWAIAHRGDSETVDSWSRAGALVLETDGTTFAEKVNHGYRNTVEPWLFIVGDDVKFHPKWLDNALTVGSSRYDVIGTNDLGTLRVQNGEHATHMLIRRSYIDRYGASWDGPGVVCHEGYRHWYVDDEIVTVAKSRLAWIGAKSSIVEHLHPFWGKAEFDPVYELGQAHADADKRLFEERSTVNA